MIHKSRNLIHGKGLLQIVAVHVHIAYDDADLPVAVSFLPVSYTHLDVYKRQRQYYGVQKSGSGVKYHILTPLLEFYNISFITILF